jgi:hypothetical protein
VPRGVAEIAVRLLIILLICAMVAHLDVIERVLGRDPPADVVAALDWHPGMANPFRLHPPRPGDGRLVRLLLVPRLVAGPFTAGFVLGSAFNFRTAAAPLVMKQYCTVAAWLVGPFDAGLQQDLASHAARWAAVQAGLDQFLTLADYGLVGLMMVAMGGFFGFAGAIYGQLGLIDGHDGRFNQLITGFFAGALAALAASALAIAG